MTRSVGVTIPIVSNQYPCSMNSPESVSSRSGTRYYRSPVLSTWWKITERGSQPFRLSTLVRGNHVFCCCWSYCLKSLVSVKLKEIVKVTCLDPTYPSHNTPITNANLLLSKETTNHPLHTLKNPPLPKNAPPPPSPRLFSKTHSRRNIHSFHLNVYQHVG